MKKAFIFGCVFVLVFAAFANAEDMTGKFAVSPFGGLGLPMGDLADDDPVAIDEGDAAYRAMGFKFGLCADYYISPTYSLGISFRYATFGAKDFEGYEPDDKMNAMIFTLNGRWYFSNPESTVLPYITWGGGIASMSFKDIEDMESGEKFDVDAITKPFILVGAGGDYFVSPTVALFAEGSFDYFFSDGGKIKIDGNDTGGEIGTNYFFLDFVVGARFYFGGKTE